MLWLSSSINDSLVNIHGKKTCRCDRSTRGGGVCIYVKSSLGPFKSSFINPDLENFTLDFMKPGLRIMKICCIYRPPR